MVGAVSNIASTTSTSKTDNALSGLATDYQSFLTLFLTQLKNQDPTEPLDTNQMTDQIVQFSQVEQQINTNAKLEAMLAAANNSSLTNSLAYVDKFVEWEGSKMNFNGRGSEFAYKLEGQASDVKITISDSSGRVVRTVDGLDGTAGKKNTAIWDGTDNAGNKLPVGVYSLKVTATAIDDSTVNAKTYITDYVSEVDFQDGNIKLHFGELAIDSSKVISIKSSAFYGNNGSGAVGNTSSDESA